jgi:hypothetical protein
MNNKLAVAEFKATYEIISDKQKTINNGNVEFMYDKLELK